MERMADQAVFILYLLAALSGGLGGCAVTAQHFLRDQGKGTVQMRASWLLAYAIIGSVFGLLFAAYMVTFTDPQSVTGVIGPAIISGIVGASALSGINITTRFLLKRLGIEVIVSVRRDNEDGGKAA